jgi:hypothetical protein
MMPLGALQLSFNKAASGSYLRTPFSWYNDKYLPGTSYGAESRDHERMRQIDHTAHFHYSYQVFTRPFVEAIGSESLGSLLHERFRMTTVVGSTHGMTLIFAPSALLLLLPRRGIGVAGQKRDDGPSRIGGWDAWLLAAPFPLMILLYLPYGFYLYQYAGAAVPTLAFWVVSGAYGLTAFLADRAGAESATPPAALPPALAAPAILGATLAAIGLLALTFGAFVLTSSLIAVVGPATLLIAGAALWPARGDGRQTWWHHGLLVFAAGGLLVLGTRGLPWFFDTQSEDWYRVPELREIDYRLATEVIGPAVVFVSPPGGDAPPEAEAVYNLGVARPDDAHVIRAHDLAARNTRLVAYYAERDPDRRVYHYHRRTRTATFLGTAAEVNARPQEELREIFNELSLPWRRRYAALLSECGYDASEMPFDPPPESQWDAKADDEPAAPEAPESARKP